MRKQIRNIMRFQAEKKGYKPSKALNSLWNEYQIKLVGWKVRMMNQIKGTTKKRTWKVKLKGM